MTLSRINDKLIKLILINLSFLFLGHCYSQELDWVKTIVGGDSQHPACIALDHEGNVYNAGTFNDTADFDPGIGVSELVSSGYSDVFIQKLDNDGNLIWVKKFGAENFEWVDGLVIDEEGNSYISGTFDSDIVDFDPSVAEFNLVNSDTTRMIYVLKLDPEGDFVWAKAIGGDDNLVNSVSDIALGDSNVYIAGSYSGTVDFDPGPSSEFRMSPYPALDNYNYYVMKLDLDGDFVWVNSGEEEGLSKSISLDLDSTENVFLTGFFKGLVDLDPGEDIALFSALTSPNTFIQKLNSDGNLEWVKSIGGESSNTRPRGLKVDQLSNVYLTGFFSETADLDPGPEELLITSEGSSDIFFMKLNSFGDLIWVKELGDALSVEIVYGFSLDNHANIYATGGFTSSLDFDPSLSVHELHSNGWRDAFIMKWDSSGVFEWANSMGAADEDYGIGITVDNDGAIYCNGSYQSDVDFYFGPDTLIMEGEDYSSIFVEKLIACSLIVDTLNVTSCDSYSWVNDSTYSSDTSLTYYLDSGSGCDSLLTLNLVINHSSYDSLIASACDSYMWIDDQIYFSDTTTTFVLTNAVGCDSTITLDLIINESDSITEIISTCDSYTWINGDIYVEDTMATYTLLNNAGCDSIIILDITINEPDSTTILIESCDTYTWIDGNTYTSDTTTNFMLSNMHGCDSLVTLVLELNYSSTSFETIDVCDSIIWIDGQTYKSDTVTTYLLTTIDGCDSLVSLDLSVHTLNTSLTITDTSVFANMEGVEYQWLDCNAGYAIVPDETSDTFIPIENGSYAVLLTLGDCSDTSECVTFNTLSAAEFLINRSVSIYPNPSSGQINIQMDGLDSFGVKVFTITGQLVYQDDDVTGTSYQFELRENNGIYIIEVDLLGKKEYHKLILHAND